MKVLHVVSECLPNVQAGYTLRTHALARAQRRTGVAASVVRVPKPRLLLQFDAGPGGAAQATQIDGVPYVDAPAATLWRRVAANSRVLCHPGWMRDLMRDHAMTRRLDAGAQDRFLDLIAASTPVSLVHAHTPQFTGAAGLRLARRLGVPFVYEVRGFHEMSAAAERLSHVKGATFAEWRDRDTALACAADAVITLGDAMRDELVARGVAPGRIHVVGNGVDADAFARPAERDAELVQRLGLAGRFVIGYCTHVRRLEGIETIIAAVGALTARRIPVAAVIVGDGPDLRRLRGLAARAGVGSLVRFVGRVPHACVHRYYSLFDAFVVPRPDEPVSRLVTPLKPLEAMAHGIPVVCSRLPALGEYVVDGRTGLLFDPGDGDDLADVLAGLYADRGRCAEIGRHARSWAVSERSWETLARRTEAIYRDLVEGR